MNRRPPPAAGAHAQVADAHSMLVSAYCVLLRDEPYRDLGADWLSRRNDEAHARRLVPPLERLGHTVVLDPVAWPADRAGTGRRVRPPALTPACNSLIHGFERF
jgi:hypothetical protein